MAHIPHKNLSVGQAKAAVQNPQPPKPIPVIQPITDALEAQQRLDVVKEAISWYGTPYRQLGYSKGPKGSVDCSMLLVGAWVGAKVLQPFDPRPYPPTWFLHQNEERYLAWMESLAVEVPEADSKPIAGDIVLFKVGHCFGHSGIMIDDKNFVHAYAKYKTCTSSSLTDGIISWRTRKFFDVWAKLRLLYPAKAS
jgi:cell wall-associated NlpC family hydrolase